MVHAVAAWAHLEAVPSLRVRPLGCAAMPAGGCGMRMPRLLQATQALATQVTQVPCSVSPPRSAVLARFKGCAISVLQVTQATQACCRSRTLQKLRNYCPTWACPVVEALAYTCESGSAVDTRYPQVPGISGSRVHPGSA